MVIAVVKEQKEDINIITQKKEPEVEVPRDLKRSYEKKPNEEDAEEKREL